MAKPIVGIIHEAMFPSEQFLRTMAKLRKTHRTEPLADQIQMVRSAFYHALRHLPQPMVDDIAECFVSRLGVTADPEMSVFDSCRELADIIDIFWESYDEEHDPIGQDSWAAISEITSDYALELDMKLVTYVMKLAVDHHAV